MNEQGVQHILKKENLQDPNHYQLFDDRQRIEQIPQNESPPQYELLGEKWLQHTHQNWSPLDSHYQNFDNIQSVEQKAQNDNLQKHQLLGEQVVQPRHHNVRLRDQPYQPFEENNPFLRRPHNSQFYQSQYIYDQGDQIDSHDHQYHLLNNGGEGIEQITPNGQLHQHPILDEHVVEHGQKSLDADIEVELRSNPFINERKQHVHCGIQVCSR